MKTTTTTTTITTTTKITHITPKSDQNGQKWPLRPFFYVHPVEPMSKLEASAGGRTHIADRHFFSEAVYGEATQCRTAIWRTTCAEVKESWKEQESEERIPDRMKRGDNRSAYVRYPCGWCAVWKAPGERRQSSRRAQDSGGGSTTPAKVINDQTATKTNR